MAGAEPSIVELRPMGIGDILDATFRLYKGRFLSFLVIALVAYLPYMLYTLGVKLAAGSPEVQSIPLDTYSPEDLEQMPMPEMPVVPMLLGLLGTMIFTLIVLPLAQAALMHSISGAILGERMSAGTAFQRAAGRLFPLLGTQFLVGIVLLLGYVLLIVPGIIFTMWFLIVAPVVVLERMSGAGAMSRSKELMKGNLRKGFAIVFLLWLLAMAIVYGGTFAFQALGLPYFLLEVCLLLMQAVVLPIQMAPIILLYYDLRVRKEAFDLQRLAESVAAPAQVMAD
ncbi:MAG: hypothetical protein PVJ57_18590 [Phycisphaerae bacterium]|jgi:hypothetical protein